MNTTLDNFIKNQTATDFATKSGKIMHAKLQSVFVDGVSSGDGELVEKIKQSSPELQRFFCRASRPEVPIAGIIDGHFVSRRIDRMVVDNDTKNVYILDYKTDIDTEKFRPKYIAQLREYKSLMSQIYRDYKISCYILWLHDWHLEKL